MKLIREFCDAGCGFEFKDKHHRDRMGLVITMGYSRSGWGSRENMINWSGEICEHCYTRLGPEVGAIWRERFEGCQKIDAVPDVVKIPKARVNPRISWRNRQIERIRKCLNSALR